MFRPTNVEIAIWEKNSLTIKIISQRLPFEYHKIIGPRLYYLKIKIKPVTYAELQKKLGPAYALGEIETNWWEQAID